MSKARRKIHEGNARNRDFLFMMIPLLFMGFFFYGPRVLLLAAAAVIAARLADILAARLRARPYDPTENSSPVIALILVCMMPATARVAVVLAAVLVAVLVGKEAFGGYNSYPFNPSAVGFCVAAVSWPNEVMRYPAPLNWLLQPGQNWEQLFSLWRFENVTLLEGPAMTLRNGGLPKIDFWDFLLGNYPGPLGAGCMLVILACALYLGVRRCLQIAAPLCFLGTVALFAFVFPRYAELSFATFPQDVLERLQVVRFEAVGGIMIFAAVFLVPEPGTLPKNTLSQVAYGILLGVATMVFRYFGIYELGACFAFLLVNAVSGYFDRFIASGMGRRKDAPAPV